MLFNRENLLKRLSDLLSEPSNLNPYLAFSGGKDSMVILDLVTQLIPGIPIVHNPKKDTHEKTVQFIYEIGMNKSINIVPPTDMLNFIAKNNFNCQIDGTRIYEYNREGKSTDFTLNGELFSRQNLLFFVEKGLFGIKHIYPIFDLTDENVYSYIKKYKVPFSDEYRLSGEINDG